MTKVEPWQHAMRQLFAGAPGEGARFILFAVMLALVALCGGSSWPTALPLLLLRPATVLLATAVMLLPGPIDRNVLRGPGLLLLALAIVIAVQLVPLPPFIWMALPGHAPFVEAAAVAEVPQPWRPITLSIDMTLNSLVALVVPGAVLLGGAALRSDQRIASAGLAIAMAVLSALLGLLQVTADSFYLYAPASIGRPTGLFANINHQAAVLAAAIPMAAAWALAGQGRRPLRVVVAGATCLLLLVTVFVTASRSGLLLAALAVLSVPLVIGDRLHFSGRTRGRVFGAVTVAMIALAAATWSAGRLGALDRLLRSGADQRVTYLPVTLQLLREYSPFGSGFGTFDAVFRRVEPDGLLKLTYFNHAHNDLLELAITGGLAAVMVILAYLAWLMQQGVELFRAKRRTDSPPLARAGFFAVLLLLLASLTDYPLRTPFAASILALATLWVVGRQNS